MLYLFHDFFIYDKREVEWQRWKNDLVKYKWSEEALAVLSCPTLRLQGLKPTTESSVPGILQARTLESIAISFSRGSSQLRAWTQVSCIAGGFFTVWATNIIEKYALNSLIN